MKLSQIRLAGRREVQGEWRELTKGLRFKIAAGVNAEFERCLRELDPVLMREVARVQAAGEALSEDLSARFSELDTRAIARTVLLDWDGLEEEDGTPIPYSVEKAEEILLDPDCRPLLRFVRKQARIGFDIEKLLREEAEGN